VSLSSKESAGDSYHSTPTLVFGLYLYIRVKQKTKLASTIPSLPVPIL
jgi:hypothetical protein